MGLEDHMVGSVFKTAFDRAGQSTDSFKIDNELGLIILASGVENNPSTQSANELVVDAIYEKLCEKITPSEFIDIDDAWMLFGEAVDYASSVIQKTKGIDTKIANKTMLEIALFQNNEAGNAEVSWAKLGGMDQYLIDGGEASNLYELKKELRLSPDLDKVSGLDWGINLSCNQLHLDVTKLEEGQKWILCSPGIQEKAINLCAESSSVDPQTYSQAIMDQAQTTNLYNDKTVIVVDPYGKKQETKSPDNHSHPLIDSDWVMEEHMVGDVSEAGVGHDKSRGNEDYHLVDKSLGLFILADAAGKHSGADFAARTVVEAVHKFLKPEIPRYIKNNTIKTFIACSYLFRQAVEYAHDELLKKAEEKSVDPVTTLEIAYLLKDEDKIKMVWTKVGDSRQYIVDEKGITDVFEPHKNKSHFSGDWWIGSDSYRPCTDITFIEEGQRWVMCSDGIVQEGIEDIMTDFSQNSQAHATSIANEAKRLKSKDDRTVIVINPYQLKVEGSDVDDDNYEEIKKLLEVSNGEEASLPSKPDSRLIRKKEDGNPENTGDGEFTSFGSQYTRPVLDVMSGKSKKLDTTERQFVIGDAIQDSLDMPTEPPKPIAPEEVDVRFSEPPEKEPSIIVNLEEQKSEQQQKKRFFSTPGLLVTAAVALAAITGVYHWLTTNPEEPEHNVPGIVQPEYPVPVAVEPPKPTPMPKPIQKPEPIGPDPEDKLTLDEYLEAISPHKSYYESNMFTKSKNKFVRALNLQEWAEAGVNEEGGEKINFTHEVRRAMLKDSIIAYTDIVKDPSSKKCDSGNDMCHSLFFMAESYISLAEFTKPKHEKDTYREAALNSLKGYLSKSNKQGPLKFGNEALKYKSDLEEKMGITPIAQSVEPEQEEESPMINVKEAYKLGHKYYHKADGGRNMTVEERVDLFKKAAENFDYAVPTENYRCTKKGRNMRCDALYFFARSHYKLAKLAEKGSEERVSHKETALNLFNRYLRSNSRGVNDSRYDVLLRWGEKARKDMRKVKALK